MPIIRKDISKTDLRELKDHRDNTAGLMLKAYTLKQLSLMDGKDTRTIKNSGRYLPIRVDNGKSISQFKAGYQKRPYMILYVRLDEIKSLFNKRTGKKLSVEI